eukprot:scaffold523_cov101-Isochrysis_galbana.AAC.5
MRRIGTPGVHPVGLLRYARKEGAAWSLRLHVIKVPPPHQPSNRTPSSIARLGRATPSTRRSQPAPPSSTRRNRSSQNRIAKQNISHLDGRRASVENVDRRRGAIFPRSSREGVGLGGERANGAQVDHVAGHLRRQRSLDVRANLHRVAAADSPEHVDAGNLL